VLRGENEQKEKEGCSSPSWGSEILEGEGKGDSFLKNASWNKLPLGKAKGDSAWEAR